LGVGGKRKSLEKYADLKESQQTVTKVTLTFRSFLKISIVKFYKERTVLEVNKCDKRHDPFVGREKSQARKSDSMNGG